MGEVPGQFSLLEHTPRGPIHFASSHARANRRDRRLLRLQHGLIELSSLFRRTPDMHSSRAIRTITASITPKSQTTNPRRGIRAPDARPCTIAERFPEASMVANDMPSAPPQRASYSIAAATSTSLTPGRIVLRAHPKQTRAEFHRPPDTRISAASFTMRARSTSGGADAAASSLSTLPLAGRACRP
jgi:hypothetical protein